MYNFRARSGDSFVKQFKNEKNEMEIHTSKRIVIAAQSIRLVPGNLRA